MRLILVCLIYISTSMAASLSDEQKLNQLIVQLKNKNPEAITEIESLYNNSKDANISLLTSYILSTAPVEKLKMHPAFYAQYYLMQNKNLDIPDRIMLSRIAGDGFFEKGQFKLALKWYKFGQETPGLVQDQKEYFTYKIAWSLLNQNKPAEAYKTLSHWLIKNHPSLLREPMIVDAGRAYSEAQFSKSGPPKENLKILPLNPQEIDFFLKGFFSGFRRSGQGLDLLVSHIEKFPFPEKGMQALLEAPFFEQKQTCAVLSYIDENNFKYWKSLSLKTRLILCLKEMSKMKNKNSIAYQTVSNYLASFDKLSYQESLLLADGFKSAKKSKSSCRQLVTASYSDELLNMDTKTASWQDWLVRATEVCINKGANKFFADRILELSDVWYAHKLEAYILSQTDFPDSYKSLLIDKWLTEYGWTAQLLKSLDYVDLHLWIDNRFDDYAKAVLELKEEDLISRFLTIIHREKRWADLIDRSEKIWPYLLKKPLFQSQFLASFLDQSTGENGERDPDFSQWPDKTIQEDLRAMWEGESGSHQKLQNLPIGLEFQHWQGAKQLLTSSQHIENTDESVISFIQEFLKLARNLQSINWSSQVLLKKSKKALLESSKPLKTMIERIAKKDSDNQQWQLIGKELDRWVIKLQ